MESKAKKQLVEDDEIKLDLKTLNNLLKNLQSPDNKIFQFVEEKQISTPITPQMEGYMGEENISCKIYKIKNINDLYLKVEIYTDSYGNGEFIRGAQFVKPRQKTITVYE